MLKRRHLLKVGALGEKWEEIHQISPKIINSMKMEEMSVKSVKYATIGWKRIFLPQAAILALAHAFY